MSIITSGNFPKTLRPGLKVVFNTEQKDKRQYHLDIFTKVDSDKQYEERMGMVGMVWRLLSLKARQFNMAICNKVLCVVLTTWF